MSTISRRELGRVAAGVVAAQALRVSAQTQPSDAPRYIGPLTGVDKDLGDRGFDPVVRTRAQYASTERRLRFQARTREDGERWQTALRAKVAELLGGFSYERAPLRPSVL